MSVMDGIDRRDEREPAHGLPDGRDIGAMDAGELDEFKAACVSLKQALDMDILAINQQIEAADFDRQIDGIEADPDWYRRAKYALASKKRAVAHLIRDITTANHRLKLSNIERDAAMQRTRERRFIAAAKRLLPREVYMRIWNATELMDDRY